MPTTRHDSSLWIHPARLPLGTGWKGYCTAPGHDGEPPGDEQLRDNCNLGYAHRCPWCPADRIWDSTRFGVVKQSEQRILVCYSCEKDHHPFEHGMLEYDVGLARWNSTHRDRRVQRMAQCYLEVYLLHKSGIRDWLRQP